MNLRQIFQFLPLVSIFSVIKRFNEVNLYGQVLLPLIGLFHFLFDRRVLKITFPLILMVVLNFVPMMQFGFSFGHVGRLGQLFLIVVFMSFVSINFEKENFRKLATGLLILSLIFFFSELLFTEPKHLFEKFNLNIPRYHFILGEVNFSGALFAGMFYLTFSQRMKWVSFGFLLLSLMTLSRGVMFAYIIWLAIWCISKFSKPFFKSVFNLGIGLFLLYPVVMVGLNSFMPIEINKKMTRVTPRYYLHSIYTIKGIEKPFGAGYFKSRALVKDYLKEFEEKYPWMFEGYDLAEQHSIQVQVFSDFGVIGYLLFSWFIFSLSRMIYSLGEEFSVAFISLLVNFSFINGLNEWILWTSLGFYLSFYYSKQNKDNAYFDWLSFIKKDNLIRI